jgi:uncharacterized protein YecE (DUF72 family)
VFAGDPQLRIGTSSWSSTDWVGPFYPPGTRPERFIEHYSSVYDTVELDATFYRVPTRAQVRAWRNRTPEGFQFAVKAPRTITHDKVLQDADGDMAAFVEVISGLGDRLGPILLQFPYFNRKVFPNARPFWERLDRFLERLPPGPRYAVEVRNRGWVGSQAQTVCSRHAVALAWVEQAWMPPARQWPELTRGPSTDFAYVRWLGDHKSIEKITTSWEEVVVDRGPIISDWVDVLNDLRRRVRILYGFFNNHFAGHAPASVEEFRRQWSARLDLVDR